MNNIPLGGTGFDVSPICVGTSALGSFPAQYGYEVISGFGVGLNLGVLILIVPFTIKPSEKGELIYSSKLQIKAKLLQIFSLLQ